MQTGLWISVLGVGVFAFAAAASPYSAVHAPAPGEPGHASILSSIYGGEWIADGVSFRRGAMRAERLADFGDGSALLLQGARGNGVDQVWSSSTVANVTLMAKHAGDRSEFGWIDDASGGGFVSLFDTGDLGASVSVAFGEEFRFALHNKRSGRVFTSRVSDNIGADGSAYDQLVTYRLTGHGTGESVWLLFWEDRIQGQSWADYDFNDAVIEVRTIPGPGSAALALAGLVAVARRRR